MFQQVNQAFEDRKYYLLLDVAEKYKITTPKNYDLQTRWMKREAEKIQQTIDKEKNTYNYSFAESETDQQREHLMRKFIHQLFRMSV